MSQICEVHLHDIIQQANHITKNRVFQYEMASPETMQMTITVNSNSNFIQELTHLLTIMVDCIRHVKFMDYLDEQMFIYAFPNQNYDLTIIEFPTQFDEYFDIQQFIKCTIFGNNMFQTNMTHFSEYRKFDIEETIQELFYTQMHNITHKISRLSYHSRIKVMTSALKQIQTNHYNEFDKYIQILLQDHFYDCEILQRIFDKNTTTPLKKINPKSITMLHYYLTPMRKNSNKVLSLMQLANNQR